MKTQHKRIVIKLVTCLISIFAIFLIVGHRYSFEKQILDEVLSSIPPSVKIQRIYKNESIFEFSYVLELYYDRDDYSEITKNYTKGGDPGIDITIKWIEDEIAKKIDISKNWSLFRQRIKGKDLYYIMSDEQQTSYLLIVGY